MRARGDGLLCFERGWLCRRYHPAHCELERRYKSKRGLSASWDADAGGGVRWFEILLLYRLDLTRSGDVTEFNFVYGLLYWYSTQYKLHICVFVIQVAKVRINLKSKIFPNQPIINPTIIQPQSKWRCSNAQSPNSYLNRLFSPVTAIRTKNQQLRNGIKGTTHLQ